MEDPIRILVVDDDPDLLAATGRILKSSGYETREARNGAEALEQVKAERPHLILLDVVLPDISGIEVCRRIKRDPDTATAHVILISSFQQTEANQSEGLESGADDYIVRPIDTRTFLARVASAVRIIRTAEALKDSETKHRLILENAQEAIFIVQDAKLTFANPATVALTGYPQETLAAGTVLNFVHPDDRPLIIDRHYKRLRGEAVPGVYVFRIVTRDGTVKWVSLNAARIVWHGRPASLNFLSDITERRRAEEALRESETLFRNLFEQHAAVKLIIDPDDGTLIDANAAAAQFYGWTREALKRMRIQDINTLAPEDVEREMEKARTLKRTYFEFRHRLADGSIRDVAVFSSRIESKGKEFLHSIVHDITQRKQTEEALHRTTERLRAALAATVRAIATVVEAKDPYTAGHQRRVADLAGTIAAEMNLGDDRRDALRMASLIHDIGKISVPAEILSKPSKLSDLEFLLIKIHPQAGYDILKDVDFPWPIARMVLEHHERMDGSGYPKGTVGADLLLESRILAVADVVEAMASYRPYRPAVGLEAALTEIAGNRGILYDPDVVDACLRLFADKGYTLNDAERPVR